MRSSRRPFRYLLFAGVLPALGSCMGSATDPNASEAWPLPLPAVRAQALSASEVVLTWPRMGLTAIEQIKIERGADDAGTFAMIAMLSGDDGEYRDVNLKPGTRYKYRLRVCRQVGCSVFITTQATTLVSVILTQKP